MQFWYAERRCGASNRQSHFLRFRGEIGRGSADSPVGNNPGRFARIRGAAVRKPAGMALTNSRFAECAKVDRMRPRQGWGFSISGDEIKTRLRGGRHKIGWPPWRTHNICWPDDPGPISISFGLLGSGHEKVHNFRANTDHDFATVLGIAGFSNRHMLRSANHFKLLLGPRGLLSYKVVTAR